MKKSHKNDKRANGLKEHMRNRESAGIYVVPKSGSAEDAEKNHWMK